MVTIIDNELKVEITKYTYDLDSKISAFFDLGNLDRSNLPVFLLPNLRIALVVNIVNKDLWKVEVGNKSTITEQNFDFKKFKDTINKYLENKEIGNRMLLTEDFTIIAHAFGVEKVSEKDYVPYDLDNKEKVELNVGLVSRYIDDIVKDKDKYLLLAFPDTMRRIDSFNIGNLLSIMVKEYVEKRYPSHDDEINKEKSLITKEGFSMIFYHLKSILRAKDTIYKETLKTYFENMSKANLLPYIPTKPYYTLEIMPKVKVGRLSDFNKKKDTLFQKIHRKVNSAEKIEKVSGEIVPFIPEYLSHLFDVDSPIISWKDFISKAQGYEMGRGYDNFYDLNNFYANPTIITIDSPVLNLEVSDVLFMGYDGEYLHMVVNSKTISKEETPEEKALKVSLERMFMAKYGLESAIVFDMYKLTNQNVDLLDD